jgi:mannose-6-phosphate isomerase-like protein (cupin superfamily)
MAGCVVAEQDVPARHGDGLTSRAILGPHVGCDLFEQDVLELAPGGSATRSTGEREEVLFVLSGHGSLRLQDADHALEPESGAYLAPGETYELRNPGDEPLQLVAVSILDPAPPDAAGGERAVVRRLADQAAEAATAQREFRIVADPATGLRSATHFVGYIPTTRAPDHMHHYDEVIYVLEGEGEMHMNGETTPLRAGSSINLPARTVHCLENIGADVMKVVAVFRPAGSPAAAYYPDGTPALAG